MTAVVRKFEAPAERGRNDVNVLMRPQPPMRITAKSGTVILIDSFGGKVMLFKNAILAQSHAD